MNSRYDNNRYKDEEWFRALVKEVEETSGNKAAAKCNVSASYINQILNDKPFPGRIDRVIAKIEGALLNQTVMCPVVGEITKDLCAENQEREWSNSNSMRTRLYRACRSGCPHSKLGDCNNADS